jgi:hypothetical protein
MKTDLRLMTKPELDALNDEIKRQKATNPPFKPVKIDLKELWKEEIAEHERIQARKKRRNAKKSTIGEKQMEFWSGEPKEKTNERTDP